MGRADTGSTHRVNRTICLPSSQEVYCACVMNAKDFRPYLDRQIELFPELFPPEISQGYRMKDICHPKKQPVPIRRIEVAGVAYIVRPSFLMPYNTGIVVESDSEGMEGTVCLGCYHLLFSAYLHQDPR